MNLLRRIHSTSWRTRIIILLLLGGAAWIIIPRLRGKAETVTFQTAQAEKGTLVIATSASGQISNANSGSIGTQASGVVTRVHVTNGQQVRQGDRIAEIELDQTAKQNYSQALSSYQSAKNSLDTALNTYYTLQADLFTQNKKFTDLAANSTYTKANGSPDETNRTLPEFIIAHDTWLASEAKYKSQENIVAQARTSLSTASLALQQSSPVIYAPISGTVTGLSLQNGTVLTSQNTSTGAVTSQKVASIKTNAAPMVTINLTEIDVPNVKIGNKATITLDAFPEKTFTGQVVSIDTVGEVTSGVTTYPTTIKFDTEVPEILSNMSATANIITQTKSDIIIVPVSAVQTTDGVTTVRVMKNAIPTTVQVETGISSDTQIEIVSGLAEGDTVVTGSITTGGTAARSTQNTSPFSAGFGGGAFRSAGGAQQIRIVR